MKPEYARRILSGEKRVEFRRVAFARPVSHFVLYATLPIGRPLALCKVGRIDRAKPADLWSSYRDVAGISEEKFRAYYRGARRAVAIAIEEVSRLARVRSLRDLGVEGGAPQSFVYLERTRRESLLRRASALRRGDETLAAR